MKKSSDFQPIYLQDAKRHIDWLYEKTKNPASSKNEQIIKPKEPSFLSKFWTFLKKVF